MSVPPVPPPLEQLGHRPFSFYPPISNIVHNEWLYRKASWSEVLVQNTKSMEEIWVPRFYLGAVSSVDEPVMIVGLVKELEYKAGALWPVRRRVIEMPRAVNESRRFRVFDADPDRPAAVIGIRVEGGSESRVGRVVLAGVALGIVGCVLVVSLFRGGVLGNRIIYGPVIQSGLGLTALDNYEDVVRLLGPPAEDRWSPERGGERYRLLGYPRQGCYVILRGSGPESARYIGAMDRSWTPIHAVRTPGRGNSLGLLQSLRRF